MKYPHPECIPPKLNSDKVPEEYHQYIGLAEKYGILDDGYGHEMIESLNETEREELKSFYPIYDQILDSWLGHPDTTDFETSEYLVFSALGMASEYICL